MLQENCCVGFNVKKLMIGTQVVMFSNGEQNYNRGRKT